MIRCPLCGAELHPSRLSQEGAAILSHYEQIHPDVAAPLPSERRLLRSLPV